MTSEREGNIKSSSTSSEVHNIDRPTAAKDLSWKEVVENQKVRAVWATVVMNTVRVCDSQKLAKGRTTFQELRIK